MPETKGVAMHWVIDRFEENTAVLENTQTLEAVTRAKDDLPAGVREGDALLQNADGSFALDRDETNDRTQRIRNRMNRILRRGQRG
jgi:hypothetical protein